MDRAHIMGLITFYSISHPELRIGQIISNAAAVGGWKGVDAFYAPDALIYAGITRLLEKEK